MPRRAASDGAHLHGLARGQHRSIETALRWQTVDGTLSNLTVPETNPEPPVPRAMPSPLSLQIFGHQKLANLANFAQLLEFTNLFLFSDVS